MIYTTSLAQRAARADRVMAEAAMQAEAARNGQGLLVAMFLGWWAPLSACGLIPWFMQPVAWLGLAVFCVAAKVPARATLRKAERLRVEIEDGPPTPDPLLN